MPLKTSRGIVVSGLVLAVSHLLFQVIQRPWLPESLPILADCALALLTSVAAWRASMRSHGFGRTLWLCVTCAAALWAVSFAIGAAITAFSTLENALNTFWYLTIIFIMVWMAFALPLFLSEDRGKPGVDWLRALDVAQLGILAFSTYLFFFYIPSTAQVPDVRRTRYFMILQLTRGAFLALGYLYRGWRSQYPDLRNLHLRLSAFFVAYSIPAALFFHARTVWHWPDYLVGFIGDLPVFFLLVTAVGWKEPQESAPQGKELEHPGGTLWMQLLPVLMSISVVAVSSLVSAQYFHMAYITVTASFVCYAARLFVMQQRQRALWAKLGAAEEKFSKAFTSNPTAILISRLSDGMCIDANERALQLINATREEVIGRTTVELGIFENMAQRDKIVQSIRSQGFVRGMSFNFRTRGRTMVESLLSAEVIKCDGESLLISSVLDMTELRKVTQQLRHAQKMELVGTLAGGVAHDFNNLMMIITGYSHLVLTSGLSGEVAEQIRRIREAADRAALLTRQLLAFSRRQMLQPRHINLNTAIFTLEGILRSTLPETISVRNSLAPDLGTVLVDPAQMDQVIMNLAINARDAMSNGGKLVFETRNLDLSSPFPQGDFQIPPGRYIMLIVSDTGVGISAEYLERVFEPFFTTKDVGSGTGLGLSMVYGIVKQSGGYVWVNSEPGTGTTFKICLPRVDQPAEIIEPADLEPEHLRGTETVLVVDDDQRICEVTASILHRLGYTVIIARSGEEALRCAHDFQGEIHLLLTDHVMATISGPRLAQQLKAQRPAMRVLYMSGYPRFSCATEAVHFPEAFLAKPFGPSDLAREARKVLSQAVA